MRRLLLSAASLAVAASALAAAHSVGAMAQEEITVEGNVAIVSDYRFRGVSQTDEFPAIQGGFDVSLPAGFYLGTWASSLDGESLGGATAEIDLYGGFAFDAVGLGFDVGVLGYTYPGADDIDIYEVYGSVTESFGELEGTFGLYYAPEQDNLAGGDDDNVYAYISAGMPLGDSPFSLSGSLGYTDGALDFTTEGDGVFDWTLGISTTVLGVDIGLTYVDTDVDEDDSLINEDLHDETVVLSFSKAL